MCALKSRSHLVTQARSGTPVATPDWGHAHPTHEPGERGPQEQLAGLGPHGLGTNPGQQQAGEIPEGQPGVAHGRHDQRVGPIDALVLKLAARVSTGQGTQHHQPRHETRVRGCFIGSNQKLHLIEAGEMVPTPVARIRKVPSQAPPGPGSLSSVLQELPDVGQTC